MQVDNETAQAAAMMPIANDVVEISDHDESENSSNSPRSRINKNAPQKLDSQVTDEKLFLESTGFGEPKVRTADYIDDDEPQEEKRNEEFKVAMENLQEQAHAEMIHNDSQPFFSKRQNSQSRQQDEQSFATRDQFFPLSTTGFQDQLYKENLLRNNAHRPEQSRTHTTLGNKNQKFKTFAPLPPSLPNQSKRNEKSRLSVKASDTYQQLRYLSQPRGTMKHSNSTGQPLPSLVKPSQQNLMKHSRSNSNMPRGHPTIFSQNQYNHNSPSKVNAQKKILQQKLQIVQAYGKTGQNQFISKGAFGGALQQIVQDKITSMKEADEVPASFQNTDLFNDKNALKRKQRLNQILNAAQRGQQKQVSPNIDVEDVAHQYHNLKIKYNKVKDENNRMNTKLTKMQRQAKQRDEQLMALNQELLDFRNDQNVANALSHQYEKVQQEKKQNFTAAVLDQSQLNTGNDSSIDNELGTINQESKFVTPLTPMMNSPTNVSYKIKQSSSNAKLEHNSMVMTLKKLITSLQKKNEVINLEMNDLKKSTKVCVYNELDVQLEAYSDECKRLRDKLEQAELKIIDTDKQIQDLRQVRDIKQHQEIRDTMKFKDHVEDIHENSQEDEDQLERSEIVAAGDEANKNDEEKIAGAFTLEPDGIDNSKEQLNNVHLTTDQSQRNEADEQQDAVNAEEKRDEPVEILVESKPQTTPSEFKKQQFATKIGHSSIKMSRIYAERPFWGKLESNVQNNNNDTATNKLAEKDKPSKYYQPVNKFYRNDTISSEKRQNPLSSVQTNLQMKQEIKSLTQKAKIKHEEHQTITKVLRKSNQSMLTRIRELEKALKVKLANDDIAIINSQKEPQNTKQRSQLRQKTPKKAKAVVQRRNRQTPSKSPIRKASQSASALRIEQEKVAKTNKKSTRKSLRNNQNPQKLDEEKQNLQQQQLEEVVKINQNKSVEVSENYSNHSFDEGIEVQQDGLLNGEVDVSTEMEQKPASETGIKDKEDDGYSSIEDENAAMEDEVEKQFQRSIKSPAPSVHSQVVQEIQQVQDPEPALQENVDLDEDIKSHYSQENEQSGRSSQAAVKPIVQEQMTSPEQIVEEQARALSEMEPKQSVESKSHNLGDVNEQGLAQQSEKTEYVEPIQKSQQHVGSQKSVQEQIADQIVENVELNHPEESEKQFQLANDDSNQSIQYEQQLPENTLINLSQRSIQSCAETPQNQELLQTDEKLSEKLQIQEGNKNNDLQEMRDEESKQQMNTSINSAQKQEKKELLMNAFRQAIIAQFAQKKQQQTTKFPSMIPSRTNKEEMSETTIEQIHSSSPNQIEGPEKQEEDGEAASQAVAAPVIEQDLEAVTQKTGKAKSAESDNMLVNIDESKQPIEGQSCGRNEDSEINSLRNPDSVHNQQQDKQIGEEQMLDIAENILKLLADKLIDAQWSVDDVFNHPQLVHLLPEYENEKDVVAISAENFLGRMYQLGFQEITQLQVACMMRVLGKSDINNAILFDDLIALLENQGVPPANKKPDSPETENPEVESPDVDENQGDFNEAHDQAIASQASEKESEQEQEFTLQPDDQDEKQSKNKSESQRSHKQQQSQSQKAASPATQLEKQKELSQQQDEVAPTQTQDEPQQEPQDEEQHQEQLGHLEDDKQQAEKEQEPENLGEEVKVESQQQEVAAPEEQEEQTAELKEKAPSEGDIMKEIKRKIAQALLNKKGKGNKINQVTTAEQSEVRDDGINSSGGEPPFSSAAKAEGSLVEEEQKVVISSAPSGPPIQRKGTRKDSILQRVRDYKGKLSPYSKMRDHISSYSSQVETLMDIFKARSYKQNIKSKSRQSETLVIQKNDFFELMNSMSNNQQQQTQQDSGATVSNATNTLQFSDSETKEIEKCVVLTPKFPNMYAIRHIETLFEALLDHFDPDSFIGQDEDLINGSSLIVANQNSLTPIREEVSNQ